jgi:VWFA-related protein
MRPRVSSKLRCVILLTLVAAILQPLCCRAQESQDSVAGAPPVFTPKKAAPDQASKQNTTPQQSPEIRVQSPIVTAPVTVIDSSGEFIYDLKEKDFQILDNGVAQHIQRVEPAIEEPIGAVLVIQTSESVGQLLQQVKPLGSMFSSLLLGQQGAAAVMAFDDRIRILQDFSTDSDKLSNTLRNLAPQGNKARLNDALERAISMLTKRPPAERRVIIAFSDGFDHGSETERDEIVRRATNNGVTIYGLGFNPAEALLKQKPQGGPMNTLDANVTRPLPPGMVPTATNSARVYDTPIPAVPIITAAGQMIRSTVASSLLEFYAGYTGGVFHSHWSENALQEQLSKIASEIQSQYELAYAPDTLNQSGFHRIQVQVNREGARVRARAGYFVGGKEGAAAPAPPPKAQ